MPGSGAERICKRYQNLWLHFIGLLGYFCSLLTGLPDLFATNPLKYGVANIAAILELTKNQKQKQNQDTLQYYIL